ncbi:hypothetical protein NLM59_04580 [Weeksellaceae bacterium KMM 9724]|uniref:hypothetical protein n=1 Tax=Profundicola chukchiensis TaxID=2961959 RepID=UPI00243994FD|nr:hypothetical protein [Profundicola chukchiensis]MDG4950190.1 hypothetical protein [Profundicola chukchiensis]
MGSVFKKPMRTYLLFEYKDNGYILDFEFSVTSHDAIGEKYDLLAELIEKLYKGGYTPSDVIEKYNYLSTYKIEQEWSYLFSKNHKDLDFTKGTYWEESSLYFVITNIPISDFGQMKYRTGASEWIVYPKYIYKWNKFKRRKTMFLIN